MESGDQDVERKFSVKVFPNKRIIMRRSHSPPPPPALPTFLPLSLSLSLILSVPPFFPFSSFSLFLSLCITGLTLVPTSLKSLACSLPLYFYNLVYFLPHSCFLYLCCFSSSSPFLPLPRFQSSSRPKAVVCCSKPLYQHIPAIVGSDSHFHRRIA